jgi:hypothetical protein
MLFGNPALWLRLYRFIQFKQSLMALQNQDPEWEGNLEIRNRFVFHFSSAGSPVPQSLGQQDNAVASGLGGFQFGESRQPNDRLGKTPEVRQVAVDHVIYLAVIDFPVHVYEQVPEPRHPLQAFAKI